MTQLNFSNKTTFYQLKGDLQLSIAVVIILDEMAFGPRVPTLSTHFEANLREAYRKEGKNDFITRDIAYLVKNGIVTILDWNKLTDEHILIHLPTFWMEWQELLQYHSLHLTLETMVLETHDPRGFLSTLLSFFYSGVGICGLEGNRGRKVSLGLDSSLGQSNSPGDYCLISDPDGVEELQTMKNGLRKRNKHLEHIFNFTRVYFNIATSFCNF
jgi:hypothetical protein